MASAKETNPKSLSKPETTNTRVDGVLLARVEKMYSPKIRGRSIMESYVPHTAERRIGNGFKKNSVAGMSFRVKLNNTTKMPTSHRIEGSFKNALSIIIAVW
jgi:hypothetical protein